MTTPHRTLQMALDALDAITDDVDGTGLNTMPSFDKAIDAIAALREALAQPAPERWMPIETAPKDVTILLYGAKRLEMCVGMHHSRDGWVTDTTSEWMSMYPPTHWMPLPAAPDHLRDTTEKAAPGEPVALESVHLTRDIKGMCTVRVNGRVAIQDNGDIIDHMATLEWFAQPAPAEDFCYCDDDISLQMVSGGAAPEGLYGRVTLKIGDAYVNYVKAQPAPAVLWMRDGRAHWLTIWERIAVRFGWQDAYSLERKYWGGGNG